MPWLLACARPDLVAPDVRPDLRSKPLGVVAVVGWSRRTGPQISTIPYGCCPAAMFENLTCVIAMLIAVDRSVRFGWRSDAGNDGGERCDREVDRGCPHGLAQCRRLPEADEQLQPAGKPLVRRYAPASATARESMLRASIHRCCAPLSNGEPGGERGCAHERGRPRRKTRQHQRLRLGLCRRSIRCLRA